VSADPKTSPVEELITQSPFNRSRVAFRNANFFFSATFMM